MTFSERGHITQKTLTSTLAWDLDVIVAAVTSADMVRVKNLQLSGSYQIDQTTEVNSQIGCVSVALMRFPDTVTTPDPDYPDGSTAGVDRQIVKWRTIWTGGQNNPVLWTMRFRAVNVKPGVKLLIGLRVSFESGASLNHRVQVASRWWQDDG